MFLIDVEVEVEIGVQVEVDAGVLLGHGGHPKPTLISHALALRLLPAFRWCFFIVPSPAMRDACAMHDADRRVG